MHEAREDLRSFSGNRTERWYGDDEMSNEKVIEYDHGSSLSFVNSLETICGLMSGFVFAGTTVIIGTFTGPPTLLSQVILFILSQTMGMLMMALWELHYINILVCLQSPKLIIPDYPERWRVVNTLITVTSFLMMFSINLLFLLKDLTLLFALSTCISVFAFALMNFRRWKPVREKINERMKGNTVRLEKLK